MEVTSNTMLNNVFFFERLLPVGGVETMIYELARKYHKDYDIAVYYISADKSQLKRLKRYVRCIKYNGEVVECRRAFLNYDIRYFIGNVRAEIVTQIVHANFKVQSNLKPHIDGRIDRYIAVSESTARAFEEVAGVKCEVCENPLSKASFKPPLFMCMAQRMSAEKGVERARALVSELDRLEDFKYYLLIFTDGRNNPIVSDNVAYMSPRLDARHYIATCDIFLALSDTEGRCYSVAEKLSSGIGRLVCTPCPSFYEQGIDDSNSIVMQFDMSNMEEVVERIKSIYTHGNGKRAFNPIEVSDHWGDYLIRSRTDYKGVRSYIVRATDVYRRFNVYDNELKCSPRKGTEFEVDEDRLETLLKWRDGALVEVARELDGEPR